MSRGFLYVSIVICISGSSAAGERAGWSQATDFQPLVVTLNAEKCEFTDGELAIFTLGLKNVSGDTLRVPSELSEYMLPITIKPDGSFVDYEGLVPFYDCESDIYDSSFLLGPGDSMSCELQRTMVVGDSGPGVYVWKYTVILGACNDVSHTYDVVVNSSTLEIVLSE